MKYALTFFTLWCSFTLFAQANSIDIGVFNVPAGSNKLEIRIRPNQNLSPTSGGYTAGLFTIKFPTSYNAVLNVVSSAYAYAQATTQPPPPTPIPNGTQGGYDYYIFSKASGSGGTFIANQEYVIAVIEVVSSMSGMGVFEIADDTWTANNNGTFYQEYNTGDAQNIIYSTSTMAALPVELVDFRASVNAKRIVELSWVSETEQDLHYYEIERSTEDQRFEVIGKSLAKGGLGLTTKYNYDDARPVSGYNFYRLKMVNTDNSFEYSPIRTVKIDGKEIGSINIQPNPSTGPFSLLFTSENEMDVTVIITNSNGILIKSQQFAVLKGGNTINFNDANLSAGKYNVTIVTPDQEKEVQQLIIVRD